MFISQANCAKLTQPVGEHDHRQGQLDAPVVLVKYGDYQCPHSYKAHCIVQQIQHDIGDRVCFVFRHFPLTQIHPQARKAAEAAESAADQSQFWQMHQLLFEQRQTLDDGSLVEYATRLNLNIPRFLWNFSQHAYAQRVQTDFLSGVESGVTGTPTFFINGVRLHESWEMETLQGEIEQVLQSH